MPEFTFSDLSGVALLSTEGHADIHVVGHGVWHVLCTTVHGPAADRQRRLAPWAGTLLCSLLRRSLCLTAGTTNTQILTNERKVLSHWKWKAIIMGTVAISSITARLVTSWGNRVQPPLGPTWSDHPDRYLLVPDGDYVCLQQKRASTQLLRAGMSGDAIFVM